jgi:hypothetical protein
MNNTLKLFSLFILLTISISCENEIEDRPGNLGSEYFPITEGKYIIYESDSIVIDDGGSKKDTLRSFIREEIGEVFTDLEGKEVNKVYRYFKRNSEDKWTLSDVWTTQKNESNALKTEENLKFIKFIFPPIKNTRWDGNAFFNTNTEQEIAGEPIKIYEGWNYRIKESDELFEINSFVFDNTVLVEQANFETAISIRESQERYAPEIGLIYKYMRIFDSQNSDATIPWEDRAEAGFIHTLKIIDFN